MQSVRPSHGGRAFFISAPPSDLISLSPASDAKGIKSLNRYQTELTKLAKRPKSPARPHTTHFIDPVSQAECVRVPLDPWGDLWAIVDAADYRHLVNDRGVTGAWMLTGPSPRGGHAYIRVNHRRWGKPRQSVPVARLILDAPPRTLVRYENGNPLDLRRENLTLHYTRQRVARKD